MVCMYLEKGSRFSDIVKRICSSFYVCCIILIHQKVADTGRARVLLKLRCGSSTRLQCSSSLSILKAVSPDPFFIAPSSREFATRQNPLSLHRIMGQNTQRRKG